MWTRAEANAWWAARTVPIGCNYVPSTAVNSTEMWAATTFDADVIDRELGWAAALGLDAVRVFLQFHVHDDDGAGHLERLGRFLDLADTHGIDVMPILFDDCAFGGASPTRGPQPDPLPLVHNSRWTPSPGPELALDPTAWAVLERYVDEVVGTFADHPRVLAWDVYNEAGNSRMGTKTLPLLDAAFRWARQVSPAQPLTAGAWWSPSPFPVSERGAAALATMRQEVVDRSDVVSFHSYESIATIDRQLAELGDHGRPVLCTEWLARIPPVPDAAPDADLSLVETHLPHFASERIGSFCWGLVNGRTQTHLPWVMPDDADAAPHGWFHDLLHSDGTPYDEVEAAIIRQHSTRGDLSTLP